LRRRWYKISAIDLDSFPTAAGPNIFIDRWQPYRNRTALFNCIGRPETWNPHATVAVINTSIDPAMTIAPVPALNHHTIITIMPLMADAYENTFGVVVIIICVPVPIVPGHFQFKAATANGSWRGKEIGIIRFLYIQRRMDLAIVTIRLVRRGYDIVLELVDHAIVNDVYVGVIDVNVGDVNITIAAPAAIVAPIPARIIPTKPFVAIVAVVSVKAVWNNISSNQYSTLSFA
jgi:hypothetical protein